MSLQSHGSLQPLQRGFHGSDRAIIVKVQRVDADASWRLCAKSFQHALIFSRAHGQHRAVAGTGGLVALAPRLSADAALADLARPALAAAAASAGLSAWFLRDVVRPWNGIVQRASVTIPLVFLCRLALRIATEPG